MLFNSTIFLIFFAILFALYYAVERKGWQLSVLIAGSLIFYAWHQPQFLALLLLSMLFNTIVCHSIQNATTNKMTRVTLATFGVVANLALLILFKYAGMLVELFQTITTVSVAQNGVAATLLRIPLPIGISFYTFEGICLLVDSVRGEKCVKRSKASKLLREVALFVGFFPHLIAGPIVRPSQFFPQIAMKRLRDIDWSFAIENLIVGYFLKVCVADNLGEVLASQMWFFPIHNGFANFVTMCFYGIRLLADYAGYSYIALGLAACLGYKLPINFHWPFCSGSWSEFWRRWNITLGSWLRDYVYIPLGGNKHGKIRTCANLFVVMVISGLWHGAGGQFALFGALLGIALCIERVVNLNGKKGAEMPLVLHVVSSLGIWIYFSMATLLFAMPIDRWLLYLSTFYSNSSIPISDAIWFSAIFASPVVLAHIFVMSRERGFSLERFRVTFMDLKLKEAVFAVMLFFMVTSYGSPQAFVYFQF